MGKTIVLFATTVKHSMVATCVRCCCAEQQGQSTQAMDECIMWTAASTFGTAQGTLKSNEKY
jgi:hypothetical protein